MNMIGVSDINAVRFLNGCIQIQIQIQNSFIVI